MQREALEDVVRNINVRLEHVEQILPTLATKAELQQAIAPLATKAELREALAEATAPLATKVELQAAIAEAIAPLATKEALTPLTTKVELHALGSELREEMRTEGERTRRYFDAVAERLEGHIRIVAEGQAHLQERFEDLRTELKADIAQLDRRVTRLEARR